MTGMIWVDTTPITTQNPDCREGREWLTRMDEGLLPEMVEHLERCTHCADTLNRAHRRREARKVIRARIAAFFAGLGDLLWTGPEGVGPYELSRRV